MLTFVAVRRAMLEFHLSPYLVVVVLLTPRTPRPAPTRVASDPFGTSD